MKPPKGVIVQGNYIGLNAAGDAAIGNANAGIETRGDGTVIGGSAPGAGNVVSGNEGAGVVVNAKSPVIKGNLIGTSADGLSAVPNAGAGVALNLGGLVGGPEPGARNVISGNDGWGIHAYFNSTVTGNYIGVDANGTSALPNSTGGVEVPRSASRVVIGGAAPGAGNVISGNTGPGIYIGDDAQTTKNVVAGNLIGTNAAGTAAVGNAAEGILVDGAAGNTIGGTKPGTGNVISGNAGAGIAFAASASATKNVVAGNLIGPDAAGTGLIGNGGDGVRLAGATGNTIGSLKKGGANTIAGNGGAGISVITGEGNAIFANSLFANGGLGIDLGGDGATPNDVDDSDAGPDGLQNYPLLGAPAVVKGKTTISGTLMTGAGSYSVYLFSGPATDSPPQARTYLGAVKVKLKTAGTAAFGLKARTAPPAGSQLTAIAVGPAGASEISAPVTA